MKVMLSKLACKIAGLTAGLSSSVLLNDAITTIDSADTLGALATTVTNGFLKILGTIVLYIAKFALSIIDLVQIVVYKFLGITIDVQDYVVYDTNNPLIRFLTNDSVIKVLQTVFGIAVVLVIVFTIFSIVMGEYNKAANDEEYSVGRVWGRAFKALFGMTIFPMAFMAVILLVNAILAGFAGVLSGGSNMTMGSQVMATCTYDANVYRNYANNDKRIPIYINFNDPYNSDLYKRYTPSELHKVYEAFATDGREIYNSFVNNSFATFAGAVEYNSQTHTLTNSNSKFNKYEKFICTAEQYYVMADFVDYAMTHNITFYYKAVSDEDIDWKYVDGTVYNPDTGSLSITYKDATNVYDGKSYTVTYQTNPYEISTPIQDAFSTLKTLLSIDGNDFNLLERIDGSINRVEWAANKVKVQLSNNYNNPQQWTSLDQILLYEYYSREYNNTFANYTINDLLNGIYLDMYTINCQYYRSYTASYVTLKSYDVAIINGNYYLLEQLTAKDNNNRPVTDSNNNPVYVFDAYGDPIYTIKNGENRGVSHLQDVTSYNLNHPGEEIGINIPVLSGEYNERFYSAKYDVLGNQLPLNVFTSFMADTVGRDDHNNIVGFIDANGTGYKNVDRVEAVKSVKKVGWANKLLGDLQTIYHNINLGQLITTGEWLSAFNSNIEVQGDEYTASFDTSLITPQGLIFSEIFLGNIVKSDGSNLGEYMFTSKYTEEQQRALILALMGEEYFSTLTVNVNYFTETFNKLFEPLLEGIMQGENQPFTEGEVSSIQLYTYKAYLSSLLLSTDAAGFFLDMSNQIILLNQLRYDIAKLQPNDNTFALIVLNEHIKAGYNEDGSSDKLKYMFSLSENGISLDKYINDTNGDGTINVYDLDANKSGNIEESELPAGLISDINSAAENMYYSFADLVISENMKGDIYYGFNLQDYEIDLTKYGFTAIRKAGKVVGYNYSNSNIHTHSQLKQYNELVAEINNVVTSMLAADESNCYLVSIYKNIKNRLDKQGVIESSSGFPAYATTFRNWLEGKLDRQDIVLSQYVSTDDVQGIVNEYTNYSNRLKKSLETLDKASKTCFNFEPAKNSIEDIIDMYYQTNPEDAVLNKDELLLALNRYDFFTVLSDDIKIYNLQKKLGEQLKLITGYANNNPEIIAETRYRANIISDYQLGHFDGDVFVADPDKIITKGDISNLQNLANAVDSAVYNQNMVDKFNKYYITYATRMDTTEEIGKTFKVVVNNHVYEMQITMPTAELAEYVIGGVYLNAIGFETAFVDNDYTGFLDINYSSDGTIKLPKGSEVKFNSINNFINNLANTTVKAYLSNLVNLTDINRNNDSLDNLYYYTENGNTYKVTSLNNFNQSQSYLKLILNFIINSNYLTEDQIKALIISTSVAGSENISVSDNARVIRYINNLSLEDTRAAFNSVISYLSGRVGEYSHLTSKQLRLKLMDALVNYNQDSGSSAKENKSRFLALFNLVCCDFLETSSAIDASGANIVKVEYQLDTTSKALVLSLAGVIDMPEDSLVGLQYTSLESKYEGFDENQGDYFIICTYDDQTNMYVPFLMSNSNRATGYTKVTEGDSVSTWLSKYGYGICQTDYYQSNLANNPDISYPVIAKGVITTDGYPTAIRQVNGITEFYRSNITIRNASELGLSAYYLTTEQISVNYNFISAITNSISKLFTGKTLVEHAYGSIPRFEISSRISLPIGVDNYKTSINGNALQLDYGFNGLNGLSSENFYSTLKINYLVLIIAIVALMPIVFKALFGVFGRVLDLTVYYLMSPVMFSTIALGKDVAEKKSSEEKTPIFSKWYKELSKKTLSVFGYVVGFQIFFILIPFICNMDLISNVDMFANIPNLSFISVSTVNQIVRIIFLICSAYLINSAPQLFADVMGQNNGIKDGDTLRSDMVNTMTEVKETLNGQRAINTVNYASHVVKDLTGVTAAQDAFGTIKKKGTKIAAKGAEMYLKAHGVPKEMAKEATKQYVKAVEDSVDAKKLLREQDRLKALDAYNQQVGASYDNEATAKRIGEIDGILAPNDDSIKALKKKAERYAKNPIKGRSNFGAYNKLAEKRKKANKKAKEKEKAKKKK